MKQLDENQERNDRVNEDELEMLSGGYGDCTVYFDCICNGKDGFADEDGGDVVF